MITMSRVCGVLLSIGAAIGQGAKPDRPNIVVILSDDAGYADFSMHGAVDIATPRIDSIASNGVHAICIR